MFFSDSDDDDDSASSNIRPTNGPSNGNVDHVQGVKDMVINTQNLNISKVRENISFNLREIENSKSVREGKKERLNEAITALMDYQANLNQQVKGLTNETNVLNGYQIKLNTMLGQL